MGPYNTEVLLVNALSATYPVAVMSDGCSLSTASPDAVLQRPATEAPRPGQASNAYAELPRHAAFLRTQGSSPSKSSGRIDSSRSSTRRARPN